MDENDIYEALGVKPPEAGEESQQAPETEETPAGGGQEQQPETETDSGPAPENEPESQEDGPETGSDVQTGEAPSGADEDAPEGQEPPRQENAAMSPEQAAKWRAMTEQAVSRALEAERARNQAQWDAFFSSAGLKNNLDGGKPITSLEEFHAWKTRYDRMRLERDLQEGKLSPEAFEAAVRAEVQRASVRNAAGQTPAGNAAGQTQTPAAPQRDAVEVTQAQIDAELAEIHRLDGSVNGLVDILKMDTGGAFRDAVRRGHSFLDAFKLANFDRLQNARQNEAAQRAAQAARNSARSKDHLRASVGGGKEGAAPVPGDVMELYHHLMPNAKEAEISGHYNRTLKEMKQGG